MLILGLKGSRSLIGFYICVRTTTTTKTTTIFIQKQLIYKNQKRLPPTGTDVACMLFGVGRRQLTNEIN